MLKKTECACGTCQQACRNTPGWFRPGEAEKAAKLLKMPMKRFFTRYLGVNWWVGGRDVFVLAPALVDRMKPGAEYPANPKGTCVFLTTEGKCQIHAAKPYECAHGNPCTPDDFADYEKERRKTVALWRKEQPQIRELLGRKPESSTLDPISAMFADFGLF